MRRIVRSVPNVRGKMRFARLFLRPFRRRGPIRIPDTFGNEIFCPSLDEPMAESLFCLGVYEPGTIKAILSKLNNGGTYLDVGSNIGAIALPIAACRPDAWVICVEGDPY